MLLTIILTKLSNAFSIESLKKDKFALLGGTYSHYDYESGWIAEISLFNFSYYYKYLGIEITAINYKWTKRYDSFLLPTVSLFFASAEMIKDTTNSLKLGIKRTFTTISTLGYLLNSTIYPKYQFPLSPYIKFNNDVYFKKQKAGKPFLTSGISSGIKIDLNKFDLRLFYNIDLIKVPELSPNNSIGLTLRLFVVDQESFFSF